MTSTSHARAKAIFLEALSRPRPARRDFVRKACAGAPDLQQEVESLLAFHEGAGSQASMSPNTAPAPRIVQHARAYTGGAGVSVAQHLVARAAKRLEVVCVATAVSVIVLWGLVNAIEGELADEFVKVWQWLPPVSVLAASLTMLVMSRLGLSPTRLVRAGLVYEVVVSVALAATQYAGAFQGVAPRDMNGDRVGLSHVATWTLFYTVLVPARPVEALLALVASCASVPLFYAQQVAAGLAPRLDPVAFGSLFVWPYAACVVMCFIAARVVHQLGVEVRQAHELGGYRLESLLGRGGMGEVWRATHHTLARPAAIKVIRQDVLGRDPARAAAAMARFEGEAQVIASLESPHTVQLYDFGVTDDGTIFYVMELLDGVDLEALVRQRGPLPPARVVHILRQACASLAEAHGRGLVHQDIKPANLCVCRRGLEHDVAKVLDFGLATTVARATRGSGTTGEGVAGTPAYMAPECVAADGAVDGRSDLYALGCVAFWLLTGRVVFERDSVRAVLEAHRGAAPEAPGYVAVSPVPPELDRVVLECLEKAPERRPQTAEELSVRLERIARALPWSEAAAAACWQDPQVRRA